MAYQNGQKADITKRRGDVVALKRAGLSERKIAVALESQGWKISHVQVHNDWVAALKEMTDSYSEEANQLRVIQTDRLQALLVVWWPKAMKADPVATDKCMKIIDSMCEINGVKPLKPLIQLVDNRSQTNINMGAGGKVSIADLSRLLYMQTKGIEPEALPEGRGE